MKFKFLSARNEISVLECVRVCLAEEARSKPATTPEPTLTPTPTPALSTKFMRLVCQLKKGTSRTRGRTAP